MFIQGEQPLSLENMFPIGNVEVYLTEASEKLYEDQEFVKVTTIEARSEDSVEFYSIYFDRTLVQLGILSPTGRFYRVLLPNILDVVEEFENQNS